MTGKEVVSLCKEKMGKAVEATKHKFTSIRAGRAKRFYVRWNKSRAIWF